MSLDTSARQALCTLVRLLALVVNITHPEAKGFRLIAWTAPLDLTVLWVLTDLSFAPKATSVKRTLRTTN